ncbi:MAG: M48 family metalloprotease [Motiliproteus sp.]|nr:M48 family metalloprotease [Motiliproteus sp.]
MNSLKTRLLPLALAFSLAPLAGTVSSSDLPTIGDATSATVSIEEEHRLGQAWIRVLRAQTPQLNDPLVYSYVENLIYQLSTFSDLPDRRLTLTVLDNPTLNAFAVPGGIVGVHSGLFQYAQTEGQFASVLAHELSHLSQRHYASSVEQQRKSLPLQLATIFGGILLAAAGGGDGATAAIATGQAALQQQQLAFSRQNEREADNIGMEVMIQAGYDPLSMPNMFTQMQRASRFQGNRVPEFLLTHPVTESRIADSQGRAAQLPTGGKRDSLQYQIMRARIAVHQNTDVAQGYKVFKAELNRHPEALQHYAFALAAIRNNRFQEAQSSVDFLLNQNSETIVYKLLQAELWLADNAAEKAEKLLTQQLALYPDNHPITVTYIQSLRLQNKNQKAVEELKQHLRLYPNDTHLWYELAEAYGLVDNILGVHQARAQYFLLVGATRKAEEQIQIALRLPKITEREKLLLEQLLKETKQIRESLKF